MTFDPTVDLRYRFPGQGRVPDAVVAGLSPWFRGMLSLAPRRVLELIAERWKTAPWLRPLEKAISPFRQPALVVGYREAYVELSLKAQPEVAWAPRPWLPTPWSFSPAEARRFLAEQGEDRALGTDDDDELEHLTRDEWNRVQFESEGLGGDDSDEESLFVSEPARREQTVTRLKRLGHDAASELVEFITAAGGLSESAPGTAGSFMTPDTLKLAGRRCPDPTWRDALV